MRIAEAFAPVERRKKFSMVVMVVLTLLFFGATYLIPQVQKTTIYFSVRPVHVANSQDAILALDPLEAASKMAEAIAGWPKDRGFQKAIIEKAGIDIKNLKRKLVANRQNLLNVFFILKLPENEAIHSETMRDATIEILQKRIEDFNAGSAAPFEITELSTSTDWREFPISWRIAAALILAAFFTFTYLYMQEAFRDKVSFAPQVYEVFPHSIVLRIQESLGRHDVKLLEQFILTFPSPRLIGTFPKCGDYFSLASTESIDEEIDTPILLVKLGETTMRELENLRSIFGDEVGMVVFEN